MKALFHPSCLAALCAALLLLGCGTEEPPRTIAPAKLVPVSSNVTLKVQGDKRQVLIDAVVCQRVGDNADVAIELVLTHQGPNNKAYEALLSADVDARDIYDALIRAHAKPGSPMQFEPVFRPARGQTIAISFRYEQDGKQHTVLAQSWLRTRSGKQVDLQWVFAGSQPVDDPLDPKKKHFMAQLDGTLIGLGVSDAALLDVSARTSAHRADLDFDFCTERIPPIGTKVTIILEPVGEYKPDKK